MLPAPSSADGGSSWFARLFGAEEASGESAFESTQALFAVERPPGGEGAADDAEALVARATGRRFRVGRFETLSLEELRRREALSIPGETLELEVVNEVGDVREMHTRQEAAAAVFQVASQFNCLEFVHSGVVPEDGVTRYEHDHTQGPACALACAASTVWRNYFAVVGDDGEALPDSTGGGSAAWPRGQRKDRQINNLAGLQRLLGEGLLEVRNGYTFCGPGASVEDIAGRVEAMTEEERDALRAALRVGVQWNAEVTDERMESKRNPETKRWEHVGTACAPVMQVFCSALALQSSPKLRLWRPLAQLVLDASYEATLAIAKQNLRAGGSPDVYLTLLGGGNFGNGPKWIEQAIRRALELYRHSGLRVHIVHFSDRAPWMGAYRRLVAEWGGAAVPPEGAGSGAEGEEQEEHGGCGG